jgi:hypothetical protein
MALPTSDYLLVLQAGHEAANGIFSRSAKCAELEGLRYVQGNGYYICARLDAEDSRHNMDEDKLKSPKPVQLQASQGSLP